MLFIWMNCMCSTAKKSVILLLLAVFSCCGKDPGAPPSTGASAEGPEWLFLTDGPYTLETQVSVTGTFTLALVRDLSLMDQADTVFRQEVTVGENGILKADLGRPEPGFYEVRLGSEPAFNIGILPEQIVSPPDAKPDFDAFWESTLSALDAVPLDPVLTRIPAYSNRVRNCFEVRYASLGGEMAGGIVSIPVQPGKYPVWIQYMGYGAEPYYFDPSANPDRIDFLVSVRGQGIFLEKEGRWIDRGLASKEDFYYRGAYADVKRAVDFAASLDRADPERMIACGESQGGAFTVVAAALDARIKAIAPAVPFMGDFPDYGKIVSWPVHEVLLTADAEGRDHARVYDILSYFDVKNFAPKVRCPAYMAFGLQDPTCPPHTNFAIYNNLGSAEKHFWCVPTCGHAMWLEPSWPPVRDAFFSEQLQ